MTEQKSTYKGQTDARRKANAKYLKESVEDIRVRVPKGDKAIIQTHADKMNESTNTFVRRAIDEAMERDNESNSIENKKAIPNTPEATTTKPAPDQSKQPIQPAEQIEPSIMNNNEPQPLNNNGSDFAQRFGFTREDMQKANEDAERWKANQANKEKEKHDRKKMRMIAINQFDGAKEGE